MADFSSVNLGSGLKSDSLFIIDTETKGILEIEDYFTREYIAKAVRTYNSFSVKIQNEGLAELDFVLILLPFKDIQKLRDGFRAKLRVTPDD